MTRLLADPRAQDTVMRCATGWLALERLSAAKDPAYFPITDANRADMAGETRAFILDTFATGTLATLLTANYTFLNRRMAQYYGLPTTGLGTTFTRVTFGAGAMRDLGILGQAALLTGLATARTSSPTQRGKLVRPRFLCQPIPPPPPGVDTNLPPPAANQSTRALYEAHFDFGNTNRSCPSCHVLMDKIGFGFEHYDGMGRYRTMDNGQTVDSSGVVVSPPTAQTRPSTASASWPPSGRERRREALPGEVLVVLRVRQRVVGTGRLHVHPVQRRRRRTGTPSRACSTASSTHPTSPAARAINHHDDAQADPQRPPEDRRRRSDRGALPVVARGQAGARSRRGQARAVLLHDGDGGPDLDAHCGISGDTITTFSASTQPLSAIRENIVLVEGLSSGGPTEGHGSPQVLCGQGFQLTRPTRRRWISSSPTS